MDLLGQSFRMLLSLRKRMHSRGFRVVDRNPDGSVPYWAETSLERFWEKTRPLWSESVDPQADPVVQHSRAVVGWWNQLTARFRHPDDPAERPDFVVIFVPEKINVDAIKMVFEKMEQQIRTDRCLLVCDGMTPSCPVKMRERPELCIETIGFEEVCCSVVEHAPNTRIVRRGMPDGRPAQHITPEMIRQHQRMLPTDPVARYLGLTPGSLVKIEGLFPDGTGNYEDERLVY